MKLFLLTRKDGCPESSPGGRAQYEGFVVCAASPYQARVIAWKESGSSPISGQFEEHNAEEVWRNIDHTDCMVIGRPSGPITEPQVILSDYYPG